MARTSLQQRSHTMHLFARFLEGPRHSPRSASRLAGTWAPAAALLAAVAGCGVPYGAPLAEAVNTCSSSSDCASTGAACVQGACVATRFDLTGLQLEVRPSTSASFGASTSFIVDPAALGVRLSSNGREVPPFDTSITVSLPPMISIQNGTVQAQCQGAQQSVPASLMLYRTAPFDGFQFPPIPVQTTTGTEPTFDVDLVPDVYDIYVVPQATPTCNDDAPYPPVFMRGVVINAPGALAVTLPPLGTFTATISELESAKDWQADVVEPVHGLPISANSQFTTSADNTGDTKITAQIAWDDVSLEPILRLAPKPGLKAGAPLPTLYWDVGEVFKGTMSNPVVTFSAEGLAVKGVPVEGLILGPDGMTRVPSQLTFQSLLLSGADAHNAAFSVGSVATSPGMVGSFSLALAPGNYAFRAVPTGNDTLSATSFTLQVPSNSPTDRCVCGISRDLKRRASLTSDVHTPTGQPLTGAFVLVAPSPMTTRSYLADTHTLDAATREVSATTDASGGFSLLADLGPSTLSVQPDPSTKMPWLVNPHLDVSSGASPMPPTLELTTPALLGGKVVDPSGMPVANAVINAWLPVPATTVSGSGTTVQIATTSTDATGAFSLVLPSSL